MTPVEVLRKAKALIEERGWTQGEYVSRDGAHCARGACYVASGSHVLPMYPVGHIDDSANDAQYALASAIGKELLHSVSDWNDEPGRTKKEVLAAFDKAIALAEGGAQ